MFPTDPRLLYKPQPTSTFSSSPRLCKILNSAIPAVVIPRWSNSSPKPFSHWLFRSWLFADLSESLTRSFSMILSLSVLFPTFPDDSLTPARQSLDIHTDHGEHLFPDSADILQDLSKQNTTSPEFSMTRQQHRMTPEEIEESKRLFTASTHEDQSLGSSQREDAKQCIPVIPLCYFDNIEIGARLGHDGGEPWLYALPMERFGAGHVIALSTPADYQLMCKEIAKAARVSNRLQLMGPCK